MNSGSIPVCRRATTCWALSYSSQSCMHTTIAASAPPGVCGLALTSWPCSLLRLARHLTVQSSSSGAYHPAGDPRPSGALALSPVESLETQILFPEDTWKQNTQHGVLACMQVCVYPSHTNTCLSSHINPLKTKYMVISRLSHFDTPVLIRLLPI